MRAALLLLAGAALLLAAGAAATRPAPGSTSLTITVWPLGSGVSHTRTLRCRPAGGTLPRPAEACLRLSRLARPFAPVPPGTACLARHYGPETAFVQGRIDERRVWARLSRRDGCQEARWQKHGWLLRAVR